MTSSSTPSAHGRRYNPLFFCMITLFIHFIDYVVYSQGTGVIVRPETDQCSGAQGPRPITDQRSPGTTEEATIDDLSTVNGGLCGVEINTPGIWWWINGTGNVIRASSCDEGTRIKVKMSIFDGSCDNLRCIAGGSRPDYECSLITPGEIGEWGSMSTAVDFPTIKGQPYYILVQQIDLTQAGAVWMRFREPDIPPNTDCSNSIGPVPHNGKPILGTTEDSYVSELQDYCIAEPHYPGVWYQIVGTGGTVTISACAVNNVDGFYFSVYHGAFCDNLNCVAGEYTTNIADEEKCTIEGVFSPKTSFEFQTREGDRYFVYIHYALTGANKPTSSFRFFVDDDDNGNSTYPNDVFISNPNFSNRTQQQEQFSVLGTPSWDRFDAKWSLKVNDQCLYEFIFQFQHDPTLPIGDQNFQGNCALQDPSTGLPFVADDGMLYHEPRQHWEMFPDYVWATIGFHHLSVDWLPCGHLPRGYSAPQYDFSFYRAPPTYRANAMQCTIRDDVDIFPGEKVCTFEQETTEGMKFFIVPASLVNRNPVVNMPSSFRRSTDGNNAFPHVGLRSWDQDKVPEFPDQWNDIALYMSSYDGDIAMWQAQIPYNLVSGSASKFTAGSAPEYFEYTIPTFPDTYAFDYDGDIIRYIALGKSSLCKEDFEAAKATFFASIPTTDSPSNSPIQPSSDVSSSPSEIPSSSNATTTLAPSISPTAAISNETSPPSDKMEGGEPPPVNNDGLPIGAWLGIALGSLVALCCCCALIAALCLHRKNSNEDEDEKEDLNGMNGMDSFDEDPMLDEDDDDYDESGSEDDDDDDECSEEEKDSEENEDSSEEDDTDDSNGSNVV